MRGRRWRANPFMVVVLSVSGVAFTGTAWDARAEPSCESASQLGQVLRNQHRLMEARATLLACAAATCPKDVRQDCTQWLGELEQRIPSVVFEVTDAAGHALTAVRITMDGAPWVNLLDGTATSVDPGRHTFVVHAEGMVDRTVSRLVTEGTKAQRVQVTMDRAAPPPKVSRVEPTSAPAPRTDARARESTATPPERRSATAQKTGALVFGGGLGLTSLVVGGVFGVLAFSAWDDADRACPTHKGCSTQATSDRDRAEMFGTISTAAVIGGSALVAGGLVLYFTAPKEATPQAGVSLAPNRLAILGRF